MTYLEYRRVAVIKKYLRSVNDINDRLSANVLRLRAYYYLACMYNTHGAHNFEELSRRTDFEWDEEVVDALRKFELAVNCDVTTELPIEVENYLQSMLRFWYKEYTKDWEKIQDTIETLPKETLKFYENDMDGMVDDLTIAVLHGDEDEYKYPESEDYLASFR